MITEVKEFMCPFDCTPSDNDIMLSIEIAKKENCIVRLSWLLKWSGKFERFIYPESTLEDIKNTLPKIYGI